MNILYGRYNYLETLNSQIADEGIEIYDIEENLAINTDERFYLVIASEAEHLLTDEEMERLKKMN